jgi:hypothetical protein
MEITKVDNYELAIKKAKYNDPLELDKGIFLKEMKEYFIMNGLKDKYDKEQLDMLYSKVKNLFNTSIFIESMMLFQQKNHTIPTYDKLIECKNNSVMNDLYILSNPNK